MSNVEIASYGIPKKNNGESSGGVVNINVTGTGGTQTIEIWGQTLDFKSPEDVVGDFRLGGGSQMRVGGYFTAFNGAYEDQYAQFRPVGNRMTNSDFVLMKTNMAVDYGRISFADDYIAEDGTVTENKMYGWMDAEGLHWEKTLLIKAETLNIETKKTFFDLGKEGVLKSGNIYVNTVWDYGAQSITFEPPAIFNDDVDIAGNLRLGKDLYTKNIYNTGEIRTKDMTVTGNLSVFNLILEQVQAAGGQAVFSPGEFHIDGIGETKTITAEQNYGVAGSGLTDTEYEVVSLYQLAEDENSQKITNTVVRGDHLLCYTANVDDDLSSIDARSWWTLVTDSAKDEDFYLNGVLRKCNRVDIVTRVKCSDNQWHDPSWHSVEVREGDNAVVMGSAQRDRQMAIAIAAHNWIDLTLLAPCFIIYENLDGFTLNGKATTYFSRNASRINSELVVDTTGQSLDEIISAIQEGQKMYMHQAWSNSQDGRTDFTKQGLDKDYLYKGLCSNNSSDDSTLTYQDYIWTLNSSRAGKLVPSRERLFLASDDNLYLDLEYDVSMLEGRDFTITAVCYMNSGGSSTYQVNETSQETQTRYKRQKIQNSWTTAEFEDRYQRCTVTLYDGNMTALDVHTFEASYEAGAILSVTDTIKMRCSDSEGNISSLTVESNAIKTRVSNAEGNISSLTQTANSLTSRISNAEGNISSLSQTASSLTSRISSAEGNISTLSQTASSLTSRISNAEGSITTLNQSASQWNVVANQFNSDGTVKSSGYVQLAINNSLSSFSVSADQVNFTTGNFYIRNQAGQVTFHVDGSGNVNMMGSVGASTFTSGTRILEYHASYYINPAVEAKHCFLCYPDIEGISIYLPSNASSYEGMEFRILSIYGTRSSGSTKVYNNNGSIYYPDPGSGYIMAYNGCRLGYNKFVDFQAMDGRWYITAGTVTPL